MVPNASSTLSQANELIDCDLLDSAEVLCSLFLSSSPGTGPDNLAVMEKRADILAIKKEHSRALGVYHQVETNRKLARKNTDSVNIKMAKCYLHVSDYSSALKEIKKTSVKERDAQTNILLAKLYKLSGLKEQAASILKDALKMLPFAVEIIEDLLDLGVRCAEIYEAVRRRLDADSATGDWAVLLLKAILSRKDCEHATCLESLSALQTVFPHNHFVMTQLAVSLTQMERTEQALEIFRSIRLSDPFSIKGMDIFAHLLYSHRGGEAELCRLASDLMAIDGTPFCRATAWTVAAMYAERKNDHEKAIMFIDNAIRLNPQYAFAYRFKGLLHLNSNRFDDSIVYFRQSNTILRDVQTYAGLVKAHLDLGQIKEASACCKEAVEFAPKSSLAAMLMGKLLEKTPQKHLESLRAYTAALKLNPFSSICAASKAEVLLSLERKDEAIQTLQSALEINPSGTLRILLGKAYSESGLIPEALDQLQLCLSSDEIDPGEQAEAQEEIDRIESQLSRLAEDEEAGGGDEDDGLYERDELSEGAEI